MMNTRKSLFLGIGILWISYSGCAGLQFQQGPVMFEDPGVRLAIQPVEPTSEELQGIELFEKPGSEPVKYQEENVIFTGIQNGQGKSMKFFMHRTEQYKPGSQDKSFTVISETVFEGEGGRLYEEKEITEKSEIIKWIRGEHASKIGQFQILDWKRTPAYPSGPAKIGDTWDYSETMTVKLKSRFAKQLHEEPYQSQAKSILKGFAVVQGRRCAVIETTSHQIKQEHLKVLWKEVQMQITADIKAVTYLDYQAGRIMAQITKTHSQTQGINLPIQETGQSQSILHLIPTPVTSDA